jgi:hypothetical protein
VLDEGLNANGLFGRIVERFDSARFASVACPELDEGLNANGFIGALL